MSHRRGDAGAAATGEPRSVEFFFGYLSHPKSVHGLQLLAPRWPKQPDVDMYLRRASRIEELQAQAVQEASEAEAAWFLRQEVAWALANACDSSTTTQLAEIARLGTAEATAEAIAAATAECCGWVDELPANSVELSEAAAPKYQNEPSASASFGVLQPLLRVMIALLNDSTTPAHSDTRNPPSSSQRPASPTTQLAGYAVHVAAHDVCGIEPELNMLHWLQHRQFA
eukprot:SAG11_NODE_469_length_9207_cov_5.391744_8_plen_227_part_00